MADKSPLPRGTITWDHLSEPLKQELRRLGLSGTAVRVLAAESGFTEEQIQGIVGATVIDSAQIDATYDAVDRELALTIINGSITDAHIGTRLPLDDELPPDPPTADQLLTVFNWFASEIKRIKGTTHWWDPPDDDLAGLAADVAALGGRADALELSARVVSATTDTMTDADSLILVDTNANAVAITLPSAAAVAVGWTCIIKDRGMNVATGARNMTLSRAGTDTFLGGATTKTMATNGIMWIVVKVNTGVWGVNAVTFV